MAAYSAAAVLEKCSPRVPTQNGTNSRWRREAITARAPSVVASTVRTVDSAVNEWTHLIQTVDLVDVIASGVNEGNRLKIVLAKKCNVVALQQTSGVRCTVLYVIAYVCRSDCMTVADSQATQSSLLHFSTKKTIHFSQKLDFFNEKKLVFIPNSPLGLSLQLLYVGGGEGWTHCY